MKIIIDKRERDLLDKLTIYLEIFENKNLILESDVLPLGDILVKDNNNILIIERKTINDLLASIKDGRYTEQSLRLSQNNECNNHNIIYLIEGNITSRSKDEKRIIYSTITSINAFKGFSVMRTSNIDETTEWLICMTDKLYRGFKNNKLLFSNNQEINNQEINKNYTEVIKCVKKENVTKDNIGEIMLMQIPGISATLAKAILNNFNNFQEFIEKINKDVSCIDHLTYECNGKSRKINKNCIENIKHYLTTLGC